MQRVIALRFLLLAAICLWFPDQAQAAPKTEREVEGLVGPVKRVVEETIFVPEVEDLETEGSLNERWTKVFNRDRTVAEEHVYRRGMGERRSINQYDENGYLRLRVTQDPDGGNEIRVVGTHDATRNVSRFETFDGDGTYSHATELIYDERDNPVEIKEIRPDGSIGIRHVSTFDELGRETRWERYKEGELQFWYEYDYYPNGQLSHVVRYNGDGSMEEDTTKTHELEFDERGNWVRRVTTNTTRYADDWISDSKTITKRETSYY